MPKLPNNESAQLLNHLYQVIYDAIYKYEAKGFNAHQRAQAISMQALEAVENWVETNSSRQLRCQLHDTPDCACG